MLATGAEEALILGIEKALKHRNSLLYDEILLVRTGKFEHIHTDRMLNVGWIKINDVIDSLFWHTFKNRFYGVAVRIDEGKAATIAHILKGEILKEDRFTHTSLADDVYVTTTIVVIEINGFFRAAELVSAKEEAFGGKTGWPVYLLGQLAFYLGVWYSVLLW